MISSRLALALCAALLFVGIGPAPVHAQQADDIQTVDYDVRDLTFPDLPDVEAPEPRRVELDNGMTIFLLEDHELPQVNAVARINAGSVYDPAEKVGLASVTGTVMRTGGTESMSPDSINQTLENIGATVETGFSTTSGQAFVSTLSDNVETVLPVFADVLQNPAFAEAKLNQAKSQQKSGISRRNDNSQQIALRELDKLVYGDDSPYARTTEYYTIDRITREDLVDFHGTYVHPENTILSVWGDFDADEMEDLLREQFADWSAPDEAEVPTPPQPTTERTSSVNLVSKSDVNQSTILMGHPGELTQDDPDYPAVTIMNEVLSGGFSGRLFQNVRKEQGLAYSVFGNYSAGYDRPGRFFAGVFTKSGTTVKAADAVLTEVNRMREDAPTDDEIGLAKDSYLNSFVFNFDTKREVLSRLMTYEYYDYPSDFLQQTKNAIEDVTADDVLRVSQAYLYPDEAHVLVVGRPDDFSEDLATLSDDGTVNEIDITIPRQPPSDGPMSDEQLAAQSEGQEMMESAHDALGGAAFDDISTMRVVTRQGGNESTMVMRLPDQFRTEMSTPMGNVTIVDNGEAMKMEVPGRGVQNAPGAMRQQVVGQLWRSTTYLMANINHEGLSFEATGTETVDGTEYQTVRVQPPAGTAYTLYLNAETMRPERMTLETTNPRSGQTVQITQVFSDYQDVSGIMVPFTTETTQSTDQGEQTSTSTVQEFEVNVDVPDNRFTLSSAE